MTDKAIATARKLVGHFKHSVVATTAHKEKASTAKYQTASPHSRCINMVEHDILHDKYNSK